VKKPYVFCALLATAFSALGAACLVRAQSTPLPAQTEYQWHLPKGFPTPNVPADNPMSDAKARLGRYLFYDKRMSVNGSESCATCHQQELAFTDGKAQAVGATGELHPRSAMSLVNVAYDAVLTWSDPGETTLEHQMLTPMFGEHPVELGMKAQGEALIAIVRGDPRYREMFSAAFPGEADPFTVTNVTRAIASFERTIISADSPYDRYHYYREDSAVSESAKHGEVLFFSEPLSCFRCHGGFDFSDATTFDGSRQREAQFHNTGLYNIVGALSYPPPNTGIFEHTNRPADVGKFKAPTLRNIALTAPYFHDGSAKTLNDVLDHYSAGGRTISSGEFAGKGFDNPNKDHLIRGFQLSPQDRADLIAFLNTLTDEDVIHNPKFSNPWENPAR
jgi:cytochrome c peroxidase